VKRLLVIFISCLLLGLVVVAGHNEGFCRVTVRLTDAETGKAVPGLIRIIDGEGKSIDPRMITDAQGMPKELLSRGLGIKEESSINHWWVINGPASFLLPREELTVEAFSGLETELARTTLDLTDHKSAEASIQLTRFYNAAKQGMYSANTHLHLMKLSRDQADRYLTEVPKADRLDMLFVSYLERADADRDYISNQYTRADLEKIGKASGTVFGNGEEHRHNFAAQGQGYGHVMLLDIPRLIRPVSIGPGIMKTGTDGLPLQRGIDQARRDEGTAIWCHNTLGLERVANQVLGRLDAQNIFDGGPHGSFKDSFYRSLNTGLKTPFSTGTDWFMYDFSRTYAKVTGPLTARSWLRSLSAGRSYITNGPLLEFKVAGKEPGDSINLDQPGSITIEARGIGRVDFQRIEIIQNGQIIRSQACHAESGHYLSETKFELSLTVPCWLALRIPPPPVKDDPELKDSVPSNEYGQPLFAHTSAIAVEIGGRFHFARDVANELLTEMRTNLRTIETQGQFADDTEKSRVTDVYHEAITEFEHRIAKANGH
jgi:hypothetical protein